MNPSRVFPLCALLVIFFFTLSNETAALPTECVTASTRKPIKDENQSCGNNVFAARAIGALVKIASYVLPWFPELPGCLRPSRPTMRIVRQKDRFGEEDDNWVSDRH